MLKKLLKNTDFLILAIVFVLVTIGIIGIYTAGYNTDINKDEYQKQIIYFLVMLAVVIFIYIIDYRYFDIFGIIMYIVSVILLVLVLFLPSIMGAKSWINLGFMLYQPSELMKIAFILVFSKVLVIFDKSPKLNIFLKILIGMTVFLIPFLLILIQPDFGTSAVFVCILIFMLFKNGLKYRYIIIALAICMISIPLVYNFILNDVQKERILVFVDPTRDPLGSGYNAIQSKIAVGSGMITGTGLLKGTQTQNGLLPIKSSDFIFSVISEELGFVVSATVVILYTILLLRMIRVSSNCQNKFASLVVIGITGMIFFHFVENIGMTMGLLPITGVPLPFISYGGSNMVTNMIAIGIVLNISARKTQDLFY